MDTREQRWFVLERPEEKIIRTSLFKDLINHYHGEGWYRRV
jgi:hypothetical protein